MYKSRFLTLSGAMPRASPPLAGGRVLCSREASGDDLPRRHPVRSAYKVARRRHPFGSARLARRELASDLPGTRAYRCCYGDRGCLIAADGRILVEIANFDGRALDLRGRAGPLLNHHIVNSDGRGHGTVLESGECEAVPDRTNRVS